MFNHKEIKLCLAIISYALYSVKKFPKEDTVSALIM